MAVQSNNCMAVQSNICMAVQLNIFMAVQSNIFMAVQSNRCESYRGIVSKGALLYLDPSRFTTDLFVVVVDTYMTTGSRVGLEERMCGAVSRQQRG